MSILCASLRYWLFASVGAIFWFGFEPLIWSGQCATTAGKHQGAAAIEEERFEQWQFQ